MADPSPTHPEAPVEPGQLNEANHVAPECVPKDINHGAMIQDVPRVGSFGIVATKHFGENEMIVAAPAGLCRLKGISPHHLNGLYDFKGSRQVLIDAIHSVASAMDAYENGWGFIGTSRPITHCIPLMEVMSLLKESPSENVETLNGIMRTTRIDHVSNGSHTNDADGTTNNLSEPAEEPSTEARALQVLRFLDGALVAEDASVRHLVYTHFTSYVSRHLL